MKLSYFSKTLNDGLQLVCFFNRSSYLFTVMIKTESLQILTSRSRLGSYNNLCKKFLKYFIRNILKCQFSINCNQKRSLKSRSVISGHYIKNFPYFQCISKRCKSKLFHKYDKFHKISCDRIFCQKKWNMLRIIHKVSMLGISNDKIVRPCMVHRNDLLLHHPEFIREFNRSEY